MTSLRASPDGSLDFLQSIISFANQNDTLSGCVFAFFRLYFVDDAAARGVMSLRDVWQSIMMTRISFERGKISCQAEFSKARSIAIDLDFDGKQPNHFGVPAATAIPIRLGDFVGATSQGGSCNVSQISLIPHCNGTHTESLGHIVEESVPVCQIAPQGLVLAALVSVDTVPLSQSQERYHASAEPRDSVVTTAGIQTGLLAAPNIPFEALVIRTLPNSTAKRTRVYTSENAPAYLTTDCMRFIAEASITHLLIDLPSVDRIQDAGRLSNHHLFWNVKPQSRRADSQSRSERTITEMIFVPDDLPDGVYLLNLQIAPFLQDAAPSRPILFPVQYLSVV